MEELAKNIVKMGFPFAHSQYNEATRFLVMIGRLAELLPLALDVRQICMALTRIIIEETDFDNCSILLWDAQQGKLSLTAAYGVDELLREAGGSDYNRNLHFRLDEGVAGQVFSSKIPIFIENSFEQALPPVPGATVPLVSMAFLPLLEVGILNISSRRPFEFTIPIRRSWELIGKIFGYFLLGVFLQACDTSSKGQVPERYEERKRAATGTRKATQESLPSAEDALYHIPQGICLLDAESLVIQVNQAIERNYGKSASCLIGRSPSVIFHDPATFDLLLKKVQNSSAEELADVPLVNARGEVYPGDINLVKLNDRHGTVQGYLLVVNDVSKKKAFAEKMLQAEKLAALGTMAGGVAHDFNNTLMTVLGNIQLILPNVPDEETLRRLKNIEKAVHDGANTVRRLQKFTERDRDSQFVPVAADVNEAIKDVFEMTRPRWKNAMEKHGHTIRFNMELGPTCYTSLHISDLREVLTNLVLNSIEAMPEGGTITLSTKVRDDSVIIDVKDTGIGMSQEVVAKIFDPFYTTKGIGNSGLGLSVSWSLIVKSGGEIQVKSKPGKGSTFTIKLPKAQPPQRASALASRSESTSAHHILIVDDDEEVLDIIKDMLIFKGYRVIAAGSGQEALELLGRENFDLVVTDLGMPGISGWEVARKAKSVRSSLPVVLLTGWGAQYEEEDLSREGVDLIISKPLSWERLIEGIDKLL